MMADQSKMPNNNDQQYRDRPPTEDRDRQTRQLIDQEDIERSRNPAPGDPERTVIHPTTALHGLDSRYSGVTDAIADQDKHMASGSRTTGGDIDANQPQAKLLGEESVGGTTQTPDQNVTEDIAASAGVELRDGQPLDMDDMMERRDDKRWELDPKSSEDYEQHRP